MARYRVLSWREIPASVEAFEGDRVVRHPLSQRFQDLIDTIAMLSGASSTDAYLEGWQPGPEGERAGDAEAVAAAVAAEIEASFEQLVQEHLRTPVPRTE